MSNLLFPDFEDDEEGGAASSLNIKSLAKALKVLEAFRGSQRFLSLGEIAKLAGLDKSAVQRITYTLHRQRYLEQDPETRRYALGNRILDLSFAFLRFHPLIERAAPILLDLRRSIDERVDLSLPDGTSLLYVIRLQSKRDALAAAHVGRRVPIFCTAGGRSVLATYDEARAREIVERSERPTFTPQTLTEPSAILEEVRQARSKGYAIQTGEWRVEEIGIAAAVVDSRGEASAAVHIAGSLMEWTREKFEKTMAPAVVAAARAIAG